MASTPPPVPHDPSTPPAHSWRGVFIDSAHTFWPLPCLELLISIMARYRLNVLHWRLTDDTSWRFPIPSFPLLTGTGAYPPSAALGGHTPTLRAGRGPSHPSRCTRGFYSEANVRHLVTYAAQRGIRIIPEICLPSHPEATILTYPTIGDRGLVNAPNSASTDTWPTRASLDFVEAAFHHACELFPSQVIHIGTTGYDRAPYHSDPPPARSAARSARTADTLFIERALHALRFHGRRAGAWDEITRTYSPPPRGSIILARRPNGVGRQAAYTSGAPWVLADATLLSITPARNPESAPPPIDQAKTLRSALPEAMDAERLRGVEALIHPTTITTSDPLFVQLLPQLIVVAEVAWHGASALPWKALTPLIEREMTELSHTVPYWRAHRA